MWYCVKWLSIIIYYTIATDWVVDSFAIDGLSASGLRVILQPVNKDGRPDGYLRVLWGTKDPTHQIWMKSEVLYTYNKDHQVRIGAELDTFIPSFDIFPCLLSPAKTTNFKPAVLVTFLIQF